MNQAGMPNPCTIIESDGIAPGSGVPTGELPPGGNGPAAQQWNNGCYAGYDHATGLNLGGS